MTMDKSLRHAAGAGSQPQRAVARERLAQLTQSDRWKEGDSPYGLPKVRVFKLAIKKKKKKKEEEGAEGAAAPAAAPAADAKKDAKKETKKK